MVLKLRNISLYLAVLFFGTLMVATILGIPMIPFLALFDYLLLLTLHDVRRRRAVAGEKRRVFFPVGNGSSLPLLP